MDPLPIVLFTAGIALLIVGAESLVRGAGHLALAIGVSPLVVGLTVVAFGTSSPELAVSVSASYGGQADLAVGNVVGSSIFNILVILGVSALAAPLVVHQQLVRFEVPLMIAVSALTLLLALDGGIQPWEGLLLLLGIVAYTWWAIRKSRSESNEVRNEYEAEIDRRPVDPRNVALDLLLIVAGLGMLVLGSEWFTDGAVEIAEFLGVSELVIGLTIVAAGTSMPELATSVVAALRGERDIAVGNAVGSNLFNLLCVLGASALVSSGGLPVADSALRFDLPVMVAVAVASLPIFFTGYVITRANGLLFLALYAAYTAYLLLDASGHDALDAYSTVMLGFILPVIAILTLADAVRYYLAGRKNQNAGA
ncbi:calcium/sodium antiporter [Tepidiforma sp.]|uniref:calcium/sodium antiporter n=1 Tax=Tepidiforma sp. TaxID=2682230 RepID=UPI002ADD4EE6|nr:calcium/sodium antiporter [Tepidiforma sp.]